MSKLRFSALLALMLLASVRAAAADEVKTVLGPRNVQLHDGAQALMAGDGEEGVRLTLLGLASAQGIRETRSAHSNLCAGYIMIDRPEEALVHCDWVLERHPDHWRAYNNRALAYMALGRLEEAEADIRRGQEINPNSRTLKIIKGMYLDKTEPVTPHIEIDERRNQAAENKGDKPT